MESTYSKIVRLKKKYIKVRIIPASLGWYIDRFFNSLHNVKIQSRDRLRDYSIKTKDITRDHIVRSRDIARDHVIKAKDIARDHIVRSKEHTHDLLVDVTDKIRDVKDEVKDTARDSIVDYKIRLADIPAIFRHVVSLIKHAPYVITEESDKKAVASMQHIVANSMNVQKRISTFYGRESVVVNPPVDIQALSTVSKVPVHGETIPELFWLSVNRITKEKRIDLQIEAFRRLPAHKLIIVGGHDTNVLSLVESLNEKLPPNVSLAGNVSELELTQRYKTCTGFLTTSLDEDFGMTAIEAMASGKPVIAPNEGGYRESVIHGKTGILIDDIDSEKIAVAVREVLKNLSTNPLYYKDACMERAKEFDVRVFANKIRGEIDAVGLGS